MTFDRGAAGGSFTSAKRWGEQYDRGVKRNKELANKQANLDPGEIMLADGQVVTEGQTIKVTVPKPEAVSA